jgi:capsular exopolysaccharide synthesis family protein
MSVAYQMMTSHLWIASQNLGVNSVVMVSAEPDVGRSVTASNLAVALTREGARVVLVDADLRQPSQHLIFGVDNKVGLTNLLGGAASMEDVLVPTKVQGLLLVPSGPVPDNPVKLLRSAEMKQFTEQIAEAADFVVFDTPAGVAFPDAVLVASCVGDAIVVHAAGRVPRGSEAEFKTRLESVGVRVLGAVLNKVRREDSSGFFHYRRSYEGITVPVLSGGKKALKNGRGGSA